MPLESEVMILNLECQKFSSDQERHVIFAFHIVPQLYFVFHTYEFLPFCTL